MPSRSSDLLDLTLNTVGSLLGVKIYFLLRNGFDFYKISLDTDFTDKHGLVKSACRRKNVRNCRVSRKLLISSSYIIRQAVKISFPSPEAK